MNSPVFGSKLGGQKLVAPPSSGATRTPSLRGSLAGSGIGRPCSSMPFAPVDGREGLGQQVLAVRAVEDEEVAVARRLQQHLARLAVEGAVDQHRDFGGVPVVRVVRRDLKAPREFAGVRVERDDAAGPRVVAGTRVAVQHRRGIAGADEHQVQIRIVGAGLPHLPAGGAAAARYRLRSEAACCRTSTAASRCRHRTSAAVPGRLSKSPATPTIT